MKMSAMKNINFSLSHAWLNVATIAMASALCVVFAWVVDGILRVQKIESEVEQINTQIEQRQDARKAWIRKATLQSPSSKAEQQLIEKHAEISLPVLDRIERAWGSQIALLSLSVKRAGHEAQFDGMTNDLEHIQAFMTRLRDGSQVIEGESEPQDGDKNAKKNLQKELKQEQKITELKNEEPLFHVKLHRISHKQDGVNTALQFTLQIEVP